MISQNSIEFAAALLGSSRIPVVLDLDETLLVASSMGALELHHRRCGARMGCVIIHIETLHADFWPVHAHQALKQKAQARGCLLKIIF